MARSLKNNITLADNSRVSNLLRFQDLVYSESLDVVLVTETWLNGSVQDSEVIPVGYNIFRVDRDDNRPGGGVLIATRGQFH